MRPTLILISVWNTSSNWSVYGLGGSDQGKSGRKMKLMSGNYALGIEYNNK